LAASVVSSSAPAIAQGNVEFVGINDLVPADNLAYLLKHDSTHGTLRRHVEAAEDGIVVNGKKVPCYSIKNPAELPWGKNGADYVVESTGLFTDYAGAENHLKAGAKRVILSAPTKDPEKVPTLLVGVNHNKFDPGEGQDRLQRQLHDQLPRADRLRDRQGVRLWPKA
jgi:glyceraldehyde 3-phosphate dehydrogenase